MINIVQVILKVSLSMEERSAYLAGIGINNIYYNSAGEATAKPGRGSSMDAAMDAYWEQQHIGSDFSNAMYEAGYSHKGNEWGYNEDVTPSSPSFQVVGVNYSSYQQFNAVSTLGLLSNVLDPRAGLFRPGGDDVLGEAFAQSGGEQDKPAKGTSNAGQIMAGTLLLGAGTSEMPPVAVGVLIGGSILAGAAYLHQYMGDPKDWHYTQPAPTGNLPFNNPPKGFDPNKGPGGYWGHWVGGAFATGYGYYRLKSEYNKRINSLPPLPVLKTYS